MALESRNLSQILILCLKLFVADSLKKSKQRFGEFEFEYFGGSDVANKLKYAQKSVHLSEVTSYKIHTLVQYRFPILDFILTPLLYYYILACVVAGNGNLRV